MRAHAMIAGELEDELGSAHDLPLLSYEVLAYLAEAPEERLRMQELAARLPLTKSGLSRLADRMEQAGLIQRRACPSDRRGVHACLTDGGRSALEQAGDVHLRVLDDRLAARLGEDELGRLREALEKLVG